MSKATSRALARGALITGMCVSIPFLLIGVIASLLTPGEIANTPTFTVAWRTLRHFQPTGFLFFGLAVLAISPLAGLMAMAVGYLFQHERRYAVIALILLAMTLTAFLLRAG